VKKAAHTGRHARTQNERSGTKQAERQAAPTRQVTRQPALEQKTTQKQTHVKSRYVPALDGLRAFAVLAVIAYHMNLGWAPGGLMGVTVFFVISGYLINGLLVKEHESSGTIRLGAFWMRRVRRLFPAILLSVLGTAALCTLFNHTLLDKMRPDILPSLLFYNNWWQIFRDISYFEAAGSPSPLTHFWSLSIEEQFYVVWPLLLLLTYRIGLNKRSVSRIALALAAVSAIAMAVLYNPQGDPSRIYYGTDTRAMSLLLGVWLAIAWPSAAFGEERSVDATHTGTWIGFNIAGVAAFAGLVAIVAFTNGFSAFPYYGGITLTSVLSAVLIAVLAVPKTWLARLFGLAPFVWIGKRSYGMYLWHFPLILLTTNANSTEAAPWWVHLVQLALIFVVAELSYTFVETPIRNGRLGEWWRARADKRNPASALTARDYAPAGCFAALLVVACIGVFVVQPTDYAAHYAGNAKQESGSSSESDGANESSNASAAAQPASASFTELFGQQHLNSAGQPIYEPLLIGDSVAAGAEDAFYETFPYGRIDAVVARNIWESPYPDYRDAGQAGDYLVICLGTNNAVVDWQIDDELLNSVDESTHVFMVNTRNTMDWMESTNETIARTPERHPNVTVIDWFGASAGHDEYFAGDGTHLTDEGAHAYIALIKDAIEQSLSKT